MLLAIALLHLAVQVTHGYNHIVADVPITAVQQAFILIVVTLLPLMASLLAFRKRLRLGAVLFSASMAASFHVRIPGALRDRQSRSPFQRHR